MSKQLQELASEGFSLGQQKRVIVGDVEAVCYAVLANALATDERFIQKGQPDPDDDRDVYLDETFTNAFLSSADGLKSLIVESGGPLLSDEAIESYLSSLSDDDRRLLSENLVDFVTGYGGAKFNRTSRLCYKHVQTLNANVDSVKSEVLEPAKRKPTVKLSGADIGKVVGKSAETIRRLFESAKSGLTPPVSGGGNRKSYHSGHLQEALEHFGHFPITVAEGKDCIVVAVANQKGGVGKSTLATTTSHNFALKGYRVLIIDLDPQSTTTTISGHATMFEEEREYTLKECFLREDFKISHKIKKVRNWANVDIIDCNIAAQGVEWEMRSAANMQQNRFANFRRLSSAIERIKGDYDVIVIDTPPSLNLFNLSAVYAADALVVPVQRSAPDVDSTMFYLEYLSDFFEEHAPEKALEMIKVVQTRFSTNNKKSEDLWRRIIEESFADNSMANGVPASSAISLATSQYRSIYEDEFDRNNRATRKRALDACNAFCDELLGELKSVWPEKL